MGRKRLLTDGEVDEIHLAVQKRRLLCASSSNAALARRFGVSPTMIALIAKHGQFYRTVIKLKKFSHGSEPETA